MERVYLDHNATTPLAPEVREAMLPWLDRWGNSSSIHRSGQAARDAVEAARDEVAALLGVHRLEIVFTGSGTEANNAVIFAAARRHGNRGRLVISSIEHPSVRRAAERLERDGMEVVRVAPGPDGVVPADAFLDAVDRGADDTVLACLMLANNELGTLQPVAEVAAGCRERGVPVLTDAVQAVGKIPVEPRQLGVDYLTLGAHKLNGPVGAAALWLAPDAPFEPYLVGGSHERQRRAGTQNVLALTGLGAAARLARETLPARMERLRALRDRFEAGLGRIPEVTVHCPDVPRLPQTSHVAFHGVEGEALLIRLDLAGYAVSTGSACSSGVVEASPTLLALGMAPREALSSLRVTFGHGNTESQVDAFLETLAHEVATLRELAGYDTAVRVAS